MPSNLTEVAIHCESIHQRFPRLTAIRLFLLAFRAYYQPDFHCLEKLPIDSEPPGVIAVAVAEHQYERMRNWLNDKFRVESEVELQGIEEMLTAVGVASKPYPPAFQPALEGAVEALRMFSQLRTQLNEGSRVDDARQRFVDRLTEALNALPR